MEKELKVVPIKNGTVIDHIAAGQALNVLKILEINARTDAVVSVVMNVRSKKMGRKDIVKVEDRELKPEEVDKIALIAPNATINIIRDSEVIEKHKVYLPKSIEGIIRCANPNCISNVEREPVISKFITVSENPPLFRCFYCERMIEDVSGYL
ncbi:MAG: aspartate carbamoyltransferase regulatory subunit [Methanophagales archaeon]|nr:aspartate carbamoyltransferase regulatory subunit [Methanophagales archaeon]